MSVEPTIGTLSLAVSGVKRLWGLHRAYTMGVFKDTDDGLREEIVRRVGMVQTHLNTLEARALEEHNVQIIQIAQRIRQNATDFEQDVRMGVSGSATSLHPQAEKLDKKQIKKLLKLDYDILERLVASTRLVNSALHDINTSPDAAKSAALELEQQLTGTKNRFSERLSFVAGIL